MKLNQTKHIREITYRAIRRLGLQQDSTGTRSFFPRRINLIAGPNGSGKSTVLDAVYAISNPGTFPALRRNNLPTNVNSLIRLRFDSDTTITAEMRYSEKYEIDHDWSPTRIDLTVNVIDVGFKSYHYRASIDTGLSECQYSDFEELTKCLYKCGIRPVRILNTTEDSISFLEAASDVLDNIKGHLFGLYSYTRAGPPIIPVLNPPNAYPRMVSYGKNGFSFRFSDDPFQPNKLGMKFIPSGWGQISNTLVNLKNAKRSSICLIEEPEVNLHPNLQRVFAKMIAETAVENDLQLFIATHSSTLLNIDTWGTGDVGFFTTDGEEVREIPLSNQLLDMLGIRGSDIFQSNGIVWVEGPSDRIYIKSLLDKIQKQKYGKIIYLENTHYSFSFFGGSCLTHFGEEEKDPLESETDELISLLSMNRHAAIFLDQDNDFGVDDYGNSFPVTKFGKTKTRVIDSIIKAAPQTAFAHITTGYTIENYLPGGLRKAHVEELYRKTSIVGLTKTQLAKKFASKEDYSAALFCESNDFPIAISRLLEKITLWNS